MCQNGCGGNGDEGVNGEWRRMGSGTEVGVERCARMAAGVVGVRE